MEYITYGQLSDKVKAFTDTQDEIIVSPEELMGYCNDALVRCESIIHTLYEDYFLADTTLALVSGQVEYSLPSDIFANKIRCIMYNNGSKVYEVYPLRSTRKKFWEIESAKLDTGGTNYNYFIKNNASTGFKLNILPTPQETSSSNVIVYYIRKMKKVTQDSDIVDVPEYYDYIAAYMKYKIFLKEGHPNAQDAADELLMLEKNMQETLANRVPDDNNEVILDFSHYEDMQ